jgi:phosphoribosyl 1,2-cyclic phosphodiesterase
MKVTFHGVRGSTPCDRDAIARYGGNTSCVEVVAEGEAPLVFDLGTGARYFGLEMDRRSDDPFRGTCLLSHLHWDHVQGLPFFSPLRHEDSELVVYAPAQVNGRSAEDVLMDSIRPPLFPIGLHDFPGRIDIRVAPERFSVGGFEVMASSVPHVGETNGYRVTHSGRSVAYVCDHQQPVDSLRIDERVQRLCAGVDLLIHDAQYTPAEFAGKSTWGHCTVEYAVWLAAQVGARRLALFHHDPDRDDDRLDRLAEDARECGLGMGVEVFAARERLTVDV